MKLYPLKYKGKIIAESGRYPFKNAVMDLWFGLITYNYPICCVWQFAKEALKSEPSCYKRQEEHKGYNPKNYEYVPCDQCLKGKEL